LLILFLAVILTAFIVFTVLTFLVVALTSLIAGILRALSPHRVYKHRR
jgi:hypothetical protein